MCVGDYLQFSCIKFCVKNGFNGARTLEMLEKCFGNDSLKKTVVYQWHERFKSGRESIEDDERSGRPSTSKTDENIDKVKEMLVKNRKLTIREIAEDLNIAYGSVQDILVNDLGLRRVAAKLVPKDLNFMQKRDRVDVIFWRKMQQIPSNSHRIHLIWLPVTSFCSIKLKNHYGERVSPAERKSWTNRRKH